MLSDHGGNDNQQQYQKWLYLMGIICASDDLLWMVMHESYLKLAMKMW